MFAFITSHFDRPAAIVQSVAITPKTSVSVLAGLTVEEIRHKAIEKRAYMLWLHSDRSQSSAYYWAQAEHGYYALGGCPDCIANGRSSHRKNA